MEADLRHPQAGEAHSHTPHLAHHFDSLEQQFDSGKLGMWLFLATEILLFSGLFCAYAVYRANHPEIFVYAHQFLDKNWGAINTVVLICSSFTMAMGVRCAQLGRTTALVVCLALTLLGGFGFLGIKYVEYKAKWEHGLLWGTHYKPLHSLSNHEGDHQASTTHAGGPSEGKLVRGVSLGESANPSIGSTAVALHDPTAPASALLASGTSTVLMTTAAGVAVERSAILPAGSGPEGVTQAAREEFAHGAEPRNVQTFFAVYFAMTGLHGVHVIVGMLCIGWVLIRSLKGHFGPEYFTPVDLVGLYWHLVDLIWIFLFPLLYLIR
jgi:cytochrome c oxidase subunit 3